MAEHISSVALLCSFCEAHSFRADQPLASACSRFVSDLELFPVILEPLLAQPAVVILHTAVALAALLLGAVQLALPVGTTRHVVVARLWGGLMLLVAVSSFFVPAVLGVYGVSPIHVLSLVVIVSVVLAVAAARAGDIAAHARIMRRLYWLALAVTGLFTLAPGRVMHAVVFGA